MTAEQNIALYRRWLDEIWGKGDYAVAEELIAEDLRRSHPHGWTAQRPCG